MADIQEIPLDAVEAPEPTHETVEDIQEIEAPAPKKRGRPPGARNSTKAKPAPPPVPKPKPKRKKAYVPPSPEESSGECTPPPRARSTRTYAPEPVDRRALAAEVLDLLQDQRVSRGMARRNHYASWFQNM